LIGWSAGAGGRRRAREFAAGQDDGDANEGAVELGFVHVCDGGFGVGGGGVDYVGGAAIGVDCGPGGG